MLGFQNPATQRSGVAATVFEEVALGPMNLGLPVAETLARTRRALATLRIEDLGDRHPGRLSGGQGQLVAIASLLAMGPRHVILDEPTAQLDPEGTRLVAEALRAVAATGTALLVAEHKTDLLDGLCGRVAVVVDGRIVLDGPASTVLGDERLEGWGVAPPSRIGLSRALAGMGVDVAGGAGTMIEISDLVHVYPEGTRALDGLDLEVAAGEAVAIVGQNGSGKSTLVRHLNGLLRPTEGTVRIDGRDITGSASHASPPRSAWSSRTRTARSSPARSARRWPSGRGTWGCAVRSWTDGSRRRWRSSGWREVADANPYDLGYSRRKLLAIASVLAMRTPVVVLDEPTTGQDLRGVARVRTIVAALAAEGRTVITISHDIRFVAETFGRVVVMRAGRIVLDGTPADVFDAENWSLLASTYLEPPLAARVGARLGVGSTPTEASLVAALAARG